VTTTNCAAIAPTDIVRPKAILFDWDNTLVDSWTTIHEALNAVMAAMARPLWSLQQTKQRVRLSLRESFPLHFGDRWEEARRIYLDVFRAIHLQRLTPLPGRGQLLEHLAAGGHLTHRPHRPHRPRASPSAGSSTIVGTPLSTRRIRVSGGPI
jgi:phosphoglycolate phosphatase-like HAD superfamily hydrolase